MSTDDNKAIVRRYLDEAWNHGNWRAAEEVVAQDVVFHDQVREDELPPGREGLRVVMEGIRTGMPDYTFDVESMVAEGDLVAVRWRSTGTHVGNFNGLPPTGRVGALEGIAVVRMKDGRIVEGWQEADRFGLAQQLGFIPRRPMPRPISKAIAFAVRARDRLAARRGR